MQVLGSSASVLAAIRDEAAAEMERITKAADDAIASLTAPQPPQEIPNRAQRMAEALKRNEESLAQTEWDARRALIEQREEWIVRVVARGNEILAETRLDDLARLAREALELVRGEKAELLVSARDRALIDDEWCRSIAPNLTLASEVAPISGGCIVRCGAIVVDNSFEERARRLEPQWRSRLAAMYRV